MPKYSFVSFPASGVKSGMDNVLHSVTKYVVGKFPHRVIRAYFTDTRDKMRNIYMNLYTDQGGDKNKTLPNNIQEIRKIERPHLYVGYTIDSFDTTETGLGEFPLLFYPNAYHFDENTTSVFPILRDKDRNITLGTYNLRIRVTSEFIFSCQNKEEQITIYVYLKNFIKEKYGYILDNVVTKYTFPEVIVMSLKNILYSKDVPLSEVDDDLDIYLKNKSNNNILPVWYSGKENSKYYEMKYTYQAVRFQLTGSIQLDDGEKRDMAYDNYTIRFPAICEFYVPINYVLKCPELISATAIGMPNLVDDYLVMDPVPDSDNNIQLLKIIKKYIDNTRRCFIDRKYYLISRDEFSLEKSEDYYNIRVAFEKEYLQIFDSLLPEERKACHKIYLYENDMLLDEKYYSIDYEDWYVYIHKGEINKLQMIEIYVNIDLLNIFIQRQKRHDRKMGKEKRK